MVERPQARLDVLSFPKPFPHMKSEWLRIGPETAYRVPRIVAKIWKTDAIYISENGTSSEDRVFAEGIPVRGHFLWSLIDNFDD